jgi:hypothetical protein
MKAASVWMLGPGQKISRIANRDGVDCLGTVKEVPVIKSTAWSN